MSGIMKPLWFEPAKHIYKFLSNPGYRNYSRLAAKLQNVERFRECKAKIDGFNLLLPDAASFLSAYKEIFVDRIYDFPCADSRPRILDLGANIGLSVLFFKSIFPQSEITAFEADPKIFEYLKRNVHGNGLDDVVLINRAAWHKNEVLQFNIEGADGGRIAIVGDNNLVRVEAVDIAEFLHGRKFNFIKMDIEGAEELVVPACFEYLHDVDYLFIEYHSKIGQKQCLGELIRLIDNAGFRIHIHSLANSPSPFIGLRINSGFDMQLNIFGWKEKKAGAS